MKVNLRLSTTWTQPVRCNGCRAEFKAELRLGKGDSTSAIFIPLEPVLRVQRNTGQDAEIIFLCADCLNAVATPTIVQETLL